MLTQSLKNINTHTIEIDNYLKVALSVDCVIFGFDEHELKVLLIRSDLDEYKNKWTLLGDLVRNDEDPDKAAYRVLQNRTGLKNVYLEQVHTFGKPHRHPAGRVVTIAYYSLVNVEKCILTTQAHELHWHSVKDIRQLAFDHKQIFDTCFQRLQSAILDRHVGFNLLPSKFSLRKLQGVYEAILGTALDRRNFRKKILAMDILEDLDEIETDVPHRPGKLYRFKGEKNQKGF
jgi:8-oxo-dGTP diphosphatase